MDFAFWENNPKKTSVLFEIDLTDGTISGYCFQMNIIGFSAYPEEDEILLDDGRPFEVVNIIKTTERDKENKVRDLILIQMRSKLPPPIKH